MSLSMGAYGFSYNAVTDGGGYSAEFGVPTEETLSADTTLNSGSISNTISGKGSLHENHFVANGAGVMAQVRADLINAENYTYSYELVPNPSAAQNAQQVQASESLDVDRATYINAVAIAAAPGLYSSASTQVIYGSLEGYSNKAVASISGAKASQNLGEASGCIQTYSGSEYIDNGKRNGSHVATFIDGDLTKYSNSASSWGETFLLKPGCEVKESSHIVGSFKSDATAGDKTILRSSDFGYEFDLNRVAKLGSGPVILQGTGGGSDQESSEQGYYVPNGEKIQDAVDVAHSGDTINVDSGNFLENIVIDKSLTIKGAGGISIPGLLYTSVDGGGSGRVFTIGQNNPNAKVKLLDMAITNGCTSASGGGIGNFGTIEIKGCTVYGNSASDGGGIANYGTATVTSSAINGNKAVSGSGDHLGGGIYTGDTGTTTINGCIISNNLAGDGGGIYNGGTTTLKGGYVSGNQADVGVSTYGHIDGGGGIYTESTMTIADCTISGNEADMSGGGIYHKDGRLYIKGDTNIENNKAITNFGGGICSNLGGSLLTLDGKKIDIADNKAKYKSGYDVWYGGYGVFLYPNDDPDYEPNTINGFDPDDQINDNSKI